MPTYRGGSVGGTRPGFGAIPAFALWMCLAPATALAQALPTPTQNATAGAAVFGEKGCIRCHTVSGLDGSLAPDLRVVARSRSFDELAAALWNHLPGMVERMNELGIERPRLSPREAGDLFAYLYTLDYFEPPGDVDEGRRLFAAKGCIVCHQVGGVGGVVGPDLDHVGARSVPIEIATAMWNHGPAMSEAARARGIDRPVFAGTELIDIIAYLESASPVIPDDGLHLLPGQPARGEELMSEKGCVGCHGVPGSGGRTAPDLADRGRGSLTDFMAAMWNKAPAMLRALEATETEFPTLSSEEVADLVAYLSSVGYFADAGNARRGRTLLDRKGCLGCHSLGGRGGSTAGDLEAARGLSLPSGVVAALWNHTMVAPARDVEGGIDWSPMTGNEMADLIAYFQARSR